MSHFKAEHTISYKYRQMKYHIYGTNNSRSYSSLTNPRKQNPFEQLTVPYLVNKFSTFYKVHYDVHNSPTSDPDESISQPLTL